MTTILLTNEHFALKQGNTCATAINDDVKNRASNADSSFRGIDLVSVLVALSGYEAEKPFRDIDGYCLGPVII
jgi:hypothetical protein